jgi:hypothetical protein
MAPKLDSRTFTISFAAVAVRPGEVIAAQPLKITRPHACCGRFFRHGDASALLWQVDPSSLCWHVLLGVGRPIIICSLNFGIVFVFADFHICHHPIHSRSRVLTETSNRNTSLTSLFDPLHSICLILTWSQEVKRGRLRCQIAVAISWSAAL